MFLGELEGATMMADVSDLPQNIQGALITIATSYSSAVTGDFVYNFNRLVSDYRAGEPGTVSQVQTYANPVYPTSDPGGIVPDSPLAPTLSKDCSGATWWSDPGVKAYCLLHPNEVAGGQLSKQQVSDLAKSKPSESFDSLANPFGTGSLDKVKWWLDNMYWIAPVGVVLYLFGPTIVGRAFSKR